MLPRLLGGKVLNFWCGDCPGPSCGLAGGRHNGCQRGLIYEQRPTKSYLKYYFDRPCGYNVGAGEVAKSFPRHKAVLYLLPFVCV